MARMPKISIVTPSYNQGAYLEQAICSILDQEYPDLEYIVIDGGSTDGSVEILQKYSERLSFWASEPDGGQYDAINRGFRRASGEVLAWLNADDLLCPWSLRLVGEIMADLPQVEWLTSMVNLRADSRGTVYAVNGPRDFPKAGFLRGMNMASTPISRGWINQESTFWRRSLFERAGGDLDTRYGLAADFDLWARFWKTADLHAVRAPLGIIRQHAERRGRLGKDRYLDEAKRSLAQHGGKSISNVTAAALMIGDQIPYIRRFFRQDARRVRFDDITRTWVIETARVSLR